MKSNLTLDLIFEPDLKKDRNFDLFEIYSSMTLYYDGKEINDLKYEFIKADILQPYSYLYSLHPNIILFSKKPEEDKIINLNLSISNLKKQNPLWRYSLKTEYINPILNPEKIIAYEPIHSGYFMRILETINVMPLIENRNSDINIGVFGTFSFYFEPFLYFLKGNTKNKIVFDWYRDNVMIQFDNDKNKSNAILTKAQYKYSLAMNRLLSDKRNIEFNTVLELNEGNKVFKTDDDIKRYENKYDFMFLELTTANKVEILRYSIELSAPYIIYKTFQMFPTLKNGANILITPISATPLFVDFLHYLKTECFRKVEFYNPKTRKPSDPFFSNFICCFGYKKAVEKTEMYKNLIEVFSKLDTANEYLYKLSFIKKNDDLKQTELYKNQRSVKNDLFRNKPNKLQEYRKNPKQPLYLFRIFGNTNVKKYPIYKTFKDYLKVIYADWKVYQERADELFKNITNVKNKNVKDILELEEVQEKILIDSFSSLSNSIEMAKFLNLKLRPNYKDIKEKNLHKIILEGFFNETSNFFKQKIDNSELLKKKSIKMKGDGCVNDELMKVNAIYDVADMILNRTNIDEWNMVRDKVHYFRRQLKTQLENERDAVNISQGGIKMWELLTNFDLIPRGRKEVNTFHICELPGSFIFATDLFIKTKRPEVEDWGFLAQSLWMSNKSKFDDSFHLVCDYPGVYDFGPKNTGDITDIDNIIYYSERLKDKRIDMITSDCGVSPTDPNPKIQILFASLLIILFCSSKGTSFVQKLYPPVSEAHFNLFLLCAKYFEEFYIAKPSVNKQQTEFYIVGLNFKDKEISKTEKSKLIKHYNKDPEAVKLKIKADETTIYSMSEALQSAASQFADEQEKTAEIVHFWHLFTKDEKERIDKFGKKKRTEWIENNMFPYIPKDGTFLLQTK